MIGLGKRQRAELQRLGEKIYEWGCRICRELTKEILEWYDKQLMEQRDKARYRNKGLRRTTMGSAQ